MTRNTSPDKPRQPKRPCRGLSAVPDPLKERMDMNRNVAKTLTLISLFFLFAANSSCFAQSSPAPDTPPPGQPAAGSQAETSTKVEILTSIDFTGNNTFSDRQLLDIIGMKVGDNLTKEMIGEAIEHIVKLYRSNGGNLSISPNVTPGQGVATIEFMIDETGTEGDAGPYQGGRSGGGNGPPPAGSPE